MGRKVKKIILSEKNKRWNYLFYVIWYLIDSSSSISRQNLFLEKAVIRVRIVSYHFIPYVFATVRSILWRRNQSFTLQSNEEQIQLLVWHSSSSFINKIKHTIRNRQICERSEISQNRAKIKTVGSPAAHPSRSYCS